MGIKRHTHHINMSKVGFNSLERLTGGHKEDCDLDKVETFSLAKERFGKGNIRFLTRK